jgi:3-dehydroquinate dehydratase-2
MRLLIINGPNLDRLGTREPEIYGSETLRDLEAQWHGNGESLGIEVETAQSNSEGGIIAVIDAARNNVDGIVINAGALTHYSLALADALSATEIPFVEVHISNVHERETWRHHSVLSEGAVAVIVGRGTRGYLDAMRHLHSTLTHPATTLSYGPEHHQVVDIRTPVGEGPHPGVMVIHGGYWRSIWLRDLMDAFAIELTSQGFATFNIEYTTGDGSYPDAVDDVVAAYDFIVDVAGDHGVEPSRLVVAGHSAGGYLALQIAHTRDGFAGALGLSAVVDLDTVATDYPTDSPVDRFIGGSRIDAPNAWEAASLNGMPHVPVHLIHGSEDEFVTPEHAEHYAQMTRGAASLTMLGGVSHMELIDPNGVAWQTVLDAIVQLSR